VIKFNRKIKKRKIIMTTKENGKQTEQPLSLSEKQAAKAAMMERLRKAGAVCNTKKGASLILPYKKQSEPKKK
jgi:hypothetical protein